MAQQEVQRNLIDRCVKSKQSGDSTKISAVKVDGCLCTGDVRTSETWQSQSSDLAYTVHCRHLCLHFPTRFTVTISVFSFLQGSLSPPLSFLSYKVHCRHLCLAFPARLTVATSVLPFLQG
ncbi:hypothetical protein BgiMline_024638 [Biomphalaria glabrata]